MDMVGHGMLDIEIHNCRCSGSSLGPDENNNC